MHYLTAYPVLAEQLEGLLEEYGLEAFEGAVDELLWELNESDPDQPDDEEALSRG